MQNQKLQRIQSQDIETDGPGKVQSTGLEGTPLLRSEGRQSKTREAGEKGTGSHMQKVSPREGNIRSRGAGIKQRRLANGPVLTKNGLGERTAKTD